MIEPDFAGNTFIELAFYNPNSVRNRCNIPQNWNYPHPRS